MIADIPSARVSGAIVIAHARILWKNGVLRIFTKKGIVWEANSKRPELLQSRWSKHWAAETVRGNVQMKSKCPTCGGWRKVTNIPAETLWEVN